MNFFYNIGVNIFGFTLKVLGLFNKKIKLGVEGRAQTFNYLEDKVQSSDKNLWFHCASLGEYEQGLPVFEALRKNYKDYKIVLSFFSPSGYEIRKNTPIADIVVYLPLDTLKNARKFLNLINPELTVFVKYDIWPNLLNELKQRQLRAILISAAFRKHQIYFKSYGTFFRNSLFAFKHIFTQNKDSKNLLESINYNSVTVSGDTRFDRVTNQLTTDNTLEFITTFKGKNLCIVAGSTWPEDESLFVDFINSNNYSNIKFIIAPHNIKQSQINNFIIKLNVDCVLFSEKTVEKLNTSKVLVIDTIGLLSKIYSYADIAYVGGAMGNTGLHNILEPAVFGVPIIIGYNHKKFPEAQALINYGGLFSISNQNQFNQKINKLIKHSDLRLESGSKSLEFINKNKGAVIQILKSLRIYNNYA